MKKLTDYVVWDANPFLDRLKVKHGYRAAAISSSSQMVDDDGVLLPTNARMVIREPVDKSAFFKIYPENLPFALKPISFKLFFYMLKKCQFNSTRVHFIPKEWMDEDRKEEGLFHSSRTVYGALRELLDNQIIARGGDNFYYINPMIGFMGNRLELLK